MQKQSWTIGSNPSCELVVNSNTVSGQHCRLTAEASGLTLTDLGSTNGTFVNGQRIDGSQAIALTDRVTLGQSLPMPWPDSLPATGERQDLKQPPTQSRPVAPTVITLGRGADNTITIGDNNVSTHHARLIIESKQLILEDLGSTNGTAIGKVENKISRATVQAHDTVFLGSTEYQILDWINRSQPAQPAPAIRAAKAGRTTKASFNTPGTIAAIAGTALLMVMLGWAVMRDRNGTATAWSQTHATSAIASAPPVDEQSLKSPARPPELEPEPAPETVVPQAVPEPRELAASTEKQLAGSLFLIVCSDAKREMAFRIGTGFAIDGQHVATSASVLRAMQRLQQTGYPRAFLFSPANETELEIVSMVIHPRFQRFDELAHKAEQEHDSMFDQLEAHPPKPEAFEEVKERLMAARVKALEAMDQKTAYDVAIIQVGHPLTEWLPEPAKETSLRPNQKLHVTGCAFDVQDPYFDRAVSGAPITLSSRVVQLVRASEDGKQRLLATGDAEQLSMAFLGSPVLNSQGQVVGVYSRPSPLTMEHGSEHEFLFDAALFQRLQECGQ